MSIDLTQVPLEDLRSEWARRNAERRKTRAGGRRKKLVRCEKCGASGGVREMRRHQCKLESGLLR